MFVRIYNFDDSHFIILNSLILMVIYQQVSPEDLAESTPPEVQRPMLDESTPQMTKTGESSVPTTGKIDLATKPGDRAHPVITLKEEHNLVESVLDMNFEGAEMNSS